MSFVQADELWNYNKDRDELSLVFSFASTENNDARNLTSEHEIRLLTADKAGNITFAVCGYMNRGEHEGEVGIAIYYYDIEKNSVEEKVFVQTDQSYGITSQKLGKLIYYSEDNGELYLLNDGVLRKTDVNKNRSEELQTGLTEGKYVISGDSHLLAYCADEDFSRITILNLQNGKNGQFLQRIKKVFVRLDLSVVILCTDVSTCRTLERQRRENLQIRCIR